MYEPERRLGRLGGALAALAIAILAFAGGPNVPHGVRSPAIVLSIGILAMAATFQRYAIAELGARLIPLLLFWAGACGATFIHTRGNIGGVALLSAISVLAVLLASGFKHEDRLELASGLVILAAVQVGLGLTEVIGRTAPLPWGRGTLADGKAATYPNPFFGGWIDRAEGTTGHPIVFSTLIAVAGIAVAAQWASLARVTRAAALVIVPVGVLIGGSRLLTFAAVVSIAAVMAAERRSAVMRMAKKFWWALMGGSIVAVGLGVLLLARVSHTGSFTNRTSSLSAVRKLIGRPLSESIFGTGFGSESTLYAHGILRENGFDVIDNQIVTTLATQGILGVLLLVLVGVYFWRRGDHLIRTFVFFFGIMMFSFDLLRWPLVVAMAFLVSTPSLARSSFSLSGSAHPRLRRASLRVPRPGKG